MKKVFRITTLISMMLIASIAWSEIINKVIYVPEDYDTIQEGIDAAVDWDVVVVADGTYTGDGNKNLDFKGKTITVTSENGPGNCIIDCEDDGRGFDFHSDEGEHSVVSGFTIQNGYVYKEVGGGIRCESASPTIAHNIIRWCNPHGHGAGISCYYGASPMITNNTITKNMAGPAGDYSGGGIVCAHASSPIIMNNIITKNSSAYGGGIRCIEGSAPTIANNLIAGNSGQGGGISCDNSSPTIINNTITQNSGWGGGIESWESSPIVLNTIVWDNSSPQILEVVGSISVTYSDVQDGWPGEGNIDADPLFVAPGGGDYHLNDYSPCIGAGMMTPDVPETDFDGEPRPNPLGSNPDMGADENPLAEPLLYGSIFGHVTDLLVGNPIESAFVIAIDTATKDKYIALTDENGDYEISDLISGAYWVYCTKKDYRPGLKKVEVVAGEETMVNFRLRRK